MPNFTARLGLRKPLTTELYDVTEVNTNMQAIDDAIVLMDAINASLAAVGSDALLKLQVTGAGPGGQRMIEGRKVGDANYGFAIDFDGSMQFGPGGATAPDTNFKRSSAGVLKTDHSLWAAGAPMASLTATDISARTMATPTGGTYSDTLATGSALSVTGISPPSGTAASATVTPATRSRG